MPSHMSFKLTTDQILDRSKTVTRRLGWERLKPGALLLAVDRVRSPDWKRLGLIRVVSVRTEPLAAITAEDCAREGFPEMSPAEFVAMFCESMGCTPETTVRRIEFEYVAETDRSAGIPLLALLF